MNLIIMRQRIIFLLKHNTLLQKVYRIVMNVVFNLWSQIEKTDNSLVLFVSLMGKSFGDSPREIYDLLTKDSRYSSLHCVWAFEDPYLYPEVQSVRIDSFSYFKTAFKAKYWITNTNIERGLSFKKNEQVYLNTWHGTALKHIGNDVMGRKDFNFGNVDFLCVAGDYDEKVFKSAFRAKEESFLRCGLPRNDELWNHTETRTTEAKTKVGVFSNKAVILYAPTWRESTNGGKSYDIVPPINFKKWEKVLGDKYIVLFRAHHQTTKVIGVEFNDFIRDVSSYPRVNDLLLAADILITDYSAIAFDYAILCKPILCFAYDYDSYLQERGTYFDIDEKYPNKSCRSEDELLDRITTIDYKKECENTKSFRDNFHQYGSKATIACVDATFGRGNN